MNTYAKVIGTTVAVVAVGALGLALLRGGTPPVAADVASPDPHPSAAVVNTASAFVRPFTYSLPTDPTFDFGAMTERYFEVRVPEWAEAGHPGGLLVQAIGGGRADPCDGASALLALDPGPEAVFDYLESIPALTITDASATTVDGTPARQAMVTASETQACPRLHVWAEEGEPFIPGTSLRLIATDVDGEPIVVTIYGEPRTPEWRAIADNIIGSIRFEAP